MMNKKQKELQELRKYYANREEIENEKNYLRILTNSDWACAFGNGIGWQTKADFRKVVQSWVDDSDLEIVRLTDPHDKSFECYCLAENAPTHLGLIITPIEPTSKPVKIPYLSYANDFEYGMCLQQA